MGAVFPIKMQIETMEHILLVLSGEKSSSSWKKKSYSSLLVFKNGSHQSKYEERE